MPDPARYLAEMERFSDSSTPPKVLLGALFLLWACLGTWICLAAPFNSGTDESTRYVAFAAAKNRWATEADFRRYGIDNYYYPPLYFLLFAPFYPDDPVFTEASSWTDLGDPNYIENGGRHIVRRDSPPAIPPQLVGLYRRAKFFSLACGLVILAALSIALALVFDGPSRWWLVLGGLAPCLLLPQFLYYQTLCNNDTLANALSALALLAFIGAWRSIRDRRNRRFITLSVIAAACVGLGLLSKQSAACLAPLLPGLTVLMSVNREKPISRRDLWKCAGFFLLLCGVVIAGGGWWMILKALEGDPTTAAAQRLAHPWALRAHTPKDLDFAISVTLKLVRSYIALFTGDIASVPDTVFLLYLAIPIVLTGWLASALVAAKRERPPVAPPDKRRRNFDRVLWITLAATVIWNLMLAGYYNLSIRAPYGRLLFPSLVASHLLLAQGLFVLGRGRPRVTAATALSLTAYLFGLFLWVFGQRLYQAVTQPAERLAPIAPYRRLHQRVLRPAWKFAVSQRFWLPPGQLLGVRVKIVRSQVPQVGAVLEARLRLFDSTGRETASTAFEASPIGDNDATFAWTDLRLPDPRSLSGVTLAAIEIDASPPRFFPDLAGIGYAVVKAGQVPGLFPATLNGSQSDDSLCLAAVYAVP